MLERKKVIYVGHKESYNYYLEKSEYSAAEIEFIDAYPDELQEKDKNGKFKKPLVAITDMYAYHTIKEFLRYNHTPIERVVFEKGLPFYSLLKILLSNPEITPYMTDVCEDVIEGYDSLEDDKPSVNMQKEKEADMVAYMERYEQNSRNGSHAHLKKSLIRSTALAVVA